MSIAQQWLNLAIAVGSFLALLVAGYWGLRRWVGRIAADARKASDQLTTSNGTTVAGYVEKSAERLERMETAIGGLSDAASMNRDLANSALALARGAHERLDDHLLKHSEK